MWNQANRPDGTKSLFHCLATAKRARQLIAGEEAEVPSFGKKPLSIAVEELYKHKVRIVSEDVDQDEE